MNFDDLIRITQAQREFELKNQINDNLSITISNSTNKRGLDKTNSDISNVKYNKGSKTATIASNANRSGTNPPRRCYGCGRSHRKPCTLTEHPDANKNKNMAWIQSYQGKEWKSEVKTSFQWT